MAAHATYDLIIKSAHVLDPGESLDGRMDIAIRDGAIAAIGELGEADAARVVDMSGPGRYVLPGLIDIHTHVARRATTAGVGMECCDPDVVGIQSGVTTVVDAGSVGAANIGAFGHHVVPRASTRILTYLNVGTFAHSTPSHVDVTRAEDIDDASIANCIEANPGLINGLKLRLVGPYILESGEDVIRRSKSIAREHGLPLMVHIGDLFAPASADRARYSAITEFLLSQLEAGDILTHLCTPNPGGVGEPAERIEQLLLAAREKGVVLDAALGMGNFGYSVARRQRDRGLAPDTVSSDVTGKGADFHSLVECMAKFIAVGYSLSDVVRMTTTAAARSVGLADSAGAIAVGRDADISVVDVVEGAYTFTDTSKERFSGDVGIAPVHTFYKGEMVPPRWGTHPWGWLPAAASQVAT